MRAKDIMKRNVVFVKTHDSIQEVVSVLMQNHISGVPIVDKENKLIGIVTEKDLVTKEKGLNISSYMEFVSSILFIDGHINGRDLAEDMRTRTAMDIMSSPVYSVHAEATLEEIATLMINRHINRIPVIDHHNKLVGIIGRSDLLPALINR